jgi:hypothetical protein
MGYIDPGTFGIVSQIGYLILFVFASVFLFFMKPLRRAVDKLLGRTEQEDAAQDSDVSSNE